ncbi:MAG: hypothetical protein P4L69_00015, partial [Desulfosporosinus sp.]|nr:hypothetical protein [Desulfosporosinus sp.]
MPPTLQEELARINRDINNFEGQIAANAAEFQKVRSAMLTGIVSYEGIRARDKIEELTSKLNALREDREKAMSRMDEAIFENLNAKEDSAIKKEEEGMYCKGG